LFVSPIKDGANSFLSSFVTLTGTAFQGVKIIVEIKIARI
jgi:hypothetical protein